MKNKVAPLLIPNSKIASLTRVLVSDIHLQYLEIRVFDLAIYHIVP